jgi:hypothetical protein
LIHVFGLLILPATRLCSSVDQACDPDTVGSCCDGLKCKKNKRKGKDKSGKDGKGSCKQSGRALLSIIDRRILNKGKEEGRRRRGRNVFGEEEDETFTCVAKNQGKAGWDSRSQPRPPTLVLRY